MFSSHRQTVAMWLKWAWLVGAWAGNICLILVLVAAAAGGGAAEGGEAER